MNGVRLSEIFRYPLKAARGLSVSEAVTDRFGLAGDRRWMLVDAGGGFVSQRQLPRLALLGAELRDDATLRLRIDGEQHDVAVPGAAAATCAVTIWGDRVEARLAARADSDWLSRRLDASLRLVHMPDSAQRAVDPAYAGAGQQVAFADGFPLLLVTQSSLDALNARLPRPVPMDRFRPNLVVDGAAPHAEDGWRRVRIGAADVRLVKPCARCVVPSIDQATGERDPTINRVLAATRRRDGQIVFGMNALADPGAVFRVGDVVTPLA